jgi:hypothetical protein
MADFSSWLQGNWFNAITAVAAIAGLLFSGINSLFMAIGYWENCKDQKVKNLFTFEARHRELWGGIKQRPELKRILAEKVDLVAQPLTPEEYVTMWQVTGAGRHGWRIRSHARFLGWKNPTTTNHGRRDLGIAWIRNGRRIDSLRAVDLF